MNPFKSFTLTWWQAGLFKMSLISLGIIMGANFQIFFLKWIVLVTIVFVLGALYVASAWWKQITRVEVIDSRESIR
jgi:hypothetical protein